MSGERVFKIRPAPVEIERTIAVSPAHVFEWWSRPERLKRWFAPTPFTVSQVEVDLRVGGTCAICMQTPDGQDMWLRAHYVEIAPPDRLVFFSENERFSAETRVSFEQAEAGTHLTLHQTYEVTSPGFLSAVAGTSENWHATLDKLEQEIAAEKLMGATV